MRAIPISDSRATVRPTHPAPASRQPDPNWRDHAACLDTDQAIWFPPDRADRGAGKRNDYSEAKRICAGCPSLFSCREWILGSHPRWHTPGTGFAGGLSPSQRQRILHERRHTPTNETDDDAA